MGQVPRNEAESARSHPLTRVAALMNQKGGVGKTTTSVNLAAGVAELGRDVLLIDLDPQAHATLHLGADPSALPASIYDLLTDDSSDPRDAIIQSRKHLDLLPAVVDLAAAEIDLADTPDRERQLSNVLDRLRGRYEFVFIDCPPSLGLLTLNGLAAAREVIVPMQAHFLALQGLGRLLETVNAVGRGVNPRLRVSGVVLCMHDDNTRHTREVVADVEGFFTAAKNADVPWRGARVFKPAVRRNIKLAECPSFGQTIFEYARWCPGALDYAELAKGFVEEWDRFRARRPEAAAPEVVVRPAPRAGATA